MSLLLIPLVVISAYLLLTKPGKGAKVWAGNYNRNVLIVKKDDNIYKFIYGKRWTPQAFFSRFKCIFGEHVFSRKEKMIEKEIILKGSILNEFVSSRRAT